MAGTRRLPNVAPAEHASGMASGIQRGSRRGTWLVAGACLVLAGAGVALFALAFRPCRLAVPPGGCAMWSLTVRSAALAADGAPAAEHRREHRLVLIGLGGDEAALLSGPLGGAADAIHAISMPDDMRLRLLRGGRPADAGPEIAGFDFNLLPLPLAAEQEWRQDVVWAALPPPVRTVSATVKRLRSGAVPQFRATYPTSIEWVDAATGRYRQVRDLVATYRFDTLRGVIAEAAVEFTVRDELPAPGGIAGRRVAYELAWLGRGRSGDPVRLRAAAGAGAQAAAMVAARRRPPPELLAHLRAGGEPFAGLADGLLARLEAR